MYQTDSQIYKILQYWPFAVAKQAEERNKILYDLAQKWNDIVHHAFDEWEILECVEQFKTAMSTTTATFKYGIRFKK